MTYRLVRRAEQRLRLACGAGMVPLQRATRRGDEDAEGAQRERRASREARSEDREQHDEGHELQHRAMRSEHALRDGLLHIAHMRRERREVRDVRTAAAVDGARRRALCLTMIALSRSTQRCEPVNAVEDLEPELGADLTRDARLRPSRHDAPAELGHRRDQPGDREAEHRIAVPERVQDSTGSPVHRARAPGERTREHTARGGQQRMAGSVHQRTDDDGEPQRRMRQNRSRGPRTEPRHAARGGSGPHADLRTSGSSRNANCKVFQAHARVRNSVR